MKGWRKAEDNAFQQNPNVAYFGGLVTCFLWSAGSLGALPYDWGGSGLWGHRLTTLYCRPVLPLGHPWILTLTHHWQVGQGKRPPVTVREAGRWGPWLMSGHHRKPKNVLIPIKFCSMQPSLLLLKAGLQKDSLSWWDFQLWWKQDEEFRDACMAGLYWVEFISGFPLREPVWHSWFCLESCTFPVPCCKGQNSSPPLTVKTE